MRGVLVTGATTPLGATLCERLLDDPRVDQVLALGIEPPAHVPPRLREEAIYLQVDLTRSRHVRRLIFGPVREHGIEAIVHAAQHRRATDTGTRVHRLNVESTRLMLRIADQHPTIRTFVLSSSSQVYLIRPQRPVVAREDAKLDLRPQASQWTRDRVEADLAACSAMGLSDLRIVVLRCAEILAPHSGSQIYDYLQSPVCFRALGYDPMVELLSVQDAARAHHLALSSTKSGVFNVPGADVLSLSAAIRKWGRRDVPLPGFLLGPLYGARALATGTDFRYRLNLNRFHLGALLDGTRARDVLGYVPEVHVPWSDPDAARPVLLAPPSR